MMRRREPVRDRRPRGRAPRARRGGALGARARRAAARRWRRASTPCCGRRGRSRTARATPGSRRCSRCARARFDALLCPANLAPVAAPRNVVILHDAAPLRHPGWYSGAYAAWQRRLLPAIARRARHVITVSAFSRAELVELLGARARRVSVVAGGVDAAFHPGADAARARADLGLGAPVRAVRRGARSRARTSARSCPRRGRCGEQGVDVVVAGGHRPQFATEQGLDELRLLGAVPDALLPGLYAGAELFALPSHYEGFGLPVLEAMAAGVPVVAADAAALPETAGGAALLVPPDGEAFRAALAALLGDAAERERLRAAGRRRAAGVHLGGDRPRRRRGAQARSPHTVIACSRPRTSSSPTGSRSSGGVAEPLARRVRHVELVRRVLGHRLEPRGGVRRVADRRVLEPPRRAHVARHHRAGVQPDAHLEAVAELALAHPGVELLEPLEHRRARRRAPGRRGRRPRPGRRTRP